MRHMTEGKVTNEYPEVDGTLALPAEYCQSQPVPRSVGHNRVIRKLLLVCGIVSPLVYVVGDITAAWRWEGYSYTDQMISELMAVEAPTRPLLVVLFSAFNVMTFAFGAGLLASASGRRALRVTGGLVLGWSVIGQLALLLAPMHVRGAVDYMTTTDAMHIAATCVGVLATLLYMGFGAAALGRRFRLYSIATVLVLLLFGAMAGLAGPGVAANLPTPWMGLLERINVYATMLWLLILAVAVLKERGGRDAAAAGLPSGCRGGSGR